MSDLLSAISKPEESIKRKEIQLEVLNRENVGFILHFTRIIVLPIPDI